MQKHSGICLFLVAADLKHNTGGNATLSVNAYFGVTNSVFSPIFLAKRFRSPTHLQGITRGWSCSNNWHGTFSTVADKAVVDF